MLNFQSRYKIAPPSSDKEFTIYNNGQSVRVEDENSVWESTYDILNGTIKLQPHSQGSTSLYHPLAAAESLFATHADLDSLIFPLVNEFRDHPLFIPMIFQKSELRMTRHQFYQIPYLWHRNGFYSSELENWITSGDTRHPERPTHASETYYRRYIQEIDSTVSFRAVDIERDLKDFHNWHNQPRVYDLWELNKTEDELRTYLQKGWQDPHQIPMIMEINGEAAGYFEFYWAAEDRIAPFCNAEAYDRGLHFLIGNKKYLGKNNTRAVLLSASHFLFLESQRTQRIVAEPRANNKMAIRYVQHLYGWRFEKEFDFPHKRAALLICDRNSFFTGGPL